MGSRSEDASQASTDSVDSPTLHGNSKQRGANDEPVDVFSSSEDTTTSEDGGTFRENLQIDMKGLVGDAVGNMSISPASRDVVLAARRGLFIIDLKAPFEVPRFLPQGGTWDVADVQWNPHHSRAQYIVSTSSEKLLIWNLLMSGKTSIEHILHSHYRAITDINWHTTECDTVVSTGIDSWIWGWDLRAPRKSIFGLCAFNAPGTQVKWNKHDANILASSHANEVLIWDRRKGSLPVTVIRGHKSRIYGIDWCHYTRNEIVTCSLDKTIKLWNIDEYASESTGSRYFPGVSNTHKLASSPKHEIQTTYPVWRARNVPFGKGILSLPQRGETALELYSVKDELGLGPVLTFEGHDDVVKEFVWRKGGQNENQFQLITWSKDRTLRFWPINPEAMQNVACGSSPLQSAQRPLESSVTDEQATMSFRKPPERSGSIPLLSAPIGKRAILAEVRAGMPPRHRTSLPAQPNIDDREYFGNRPGPPVERHGAGISSSVDTIHPHEATSFIKASSINLASAAGRGTMSRGAAGGNKKRANVDPLSWLSSVKVGDGRRDSSSGPGSRGDSNEALRLRSRSRGPGQDVNPPSSAGTKRKRSESRNRSAIEEKDPGQSLQDEITSVLTKLASSKIKLEKHDLTKKRTCTLGLQVPWGVSSSVFIRVTFTFPRDYPQAAHPDGTPTIELDRTPLISIRDRAFILRRLRTIRERRRPCLEACLRLLLFKNEDEQAEIPLQLDSESSSDEQASGAPLDRRVTSTLLRNSKNLAEPRTSQGSFGPNGELVCFFAAPPRIIRSAGHGSTISPSKSSENLPDEKTEEAGPRMFQSPSLVSEAIRRLSSAASDRMIKTESRRSYSSEHVTRMMTTLFTIPRHTNNVKESSQYSPNPNSYVMPSRRSTVMISNTVSIAGSDKTVAEDYIFHAPEIPAMCDQNAGFAECHGRYDHERIFRMLGALLKTWVHSEGVRYNKQSIFLIRQIVNRLLSDLRCQKDIQMLAMVAVVLLKAFPLRSRPPKNLQTPKSTLSSAPYTGIMFMTRFGDYFSIPRRMSAVQRISPNSSIGSLRGPATPTQASSLNGSRPPWSGLLNAGGVRLVANVQDSPKAPLSPSGTMPSTTPPRTPFPIRGAFHEPDSPIPRHGGLRKDSTLASISKSWTDTFSSGRASVSFSPEYRLPVRATERAKKENRKQGTIVFHEQLTEESETEHIFGRVEVDLLLRHVEVYADVLLRWQLPHKRLELLKAVSDSALRDSSEHSIGLDRTCPVCATHSVPKATLCPFCGNSFGVSVCSICRLSVKGLSINCMRCLHTSHIACWKKLRTSICPSGCGCRCA
ncbi:hypothetical protein E1B28_007344 [Marasmius oreades]|uniref:WDR59/RTC1-like RING zinc finger domain-containing protein n=1 Tax=Marasmius oreades TaxID=181124 RepID=A0A9P7S1G4_9AGAR|nr:uncharacterized protein E1B28_007344 [Marasmius oreades]KAG7093686.1 hypothetical protein E1B28_007344 [Marasmius oreades]